MVLVKTADTVRGLRLPANKSDPVAPVDTEQVATRGVVPEIAWLAQISVAPIKKRTLPVGSCAATALPGAVTVNVAVRIHPDAPVTMETIEPWRAREVEAGLMVTACAAESGEFWKFVSPA
jgi:hypothetical protein